MTAHDRIVKANRDMVIMLETEAYRNWPDASKAMADLAALLPIPRRASAATIGGDVIKAIVIPITVDLTEG